MKWVALLVLVCLASAALLLCPQFYGIELKSWPPWNDPRWGDPHWFEDAGPNEACYDIMQQWDHFELGCNDRVTGVI